MTEAEYTQRIEASDAEDRFREQVEFELIREDLRERLRAELDGGSSAGEQVYEDLLTILEKYIRLGRMDAPGHFYTTTEALYGAASSPTKSSTASWPRPTHTRRSR
jgi:hypothetical protein